MNPQTTKNFEKDYSGSDFYADSHSLQSSKIIKEEYKQLIEEEK